MAAAATSAPATEAAAPSKKQVVVKPERPDEEAFKKAEAAAKKELEAAQKELVRVSSPTLPQLHFQLLTHLNSTECHQSAARLG
jgi:hypothetical protein